MAAWGYNPKATAVGGWGQREGEGKAESGKRVGRKIGLCNRRPSGVGGFLVFEKGVLGAKGGSWTAQKAL